MKHTNKVLIFQNTLKKVLDGEIEMKNNIVKQVEKNYKEYNLLSKVSLMKLKKIYFRKHFIIVLEPQIF